MLFSRILDSIIISSLSSRNILFYFSPFLGPRKYCQPWDPCWPTKSEVDKLKQKFEYVKINILWTQTFKQKFLEAEAVFVLFWGLKVTAFQDL